jgi:hypothetical protein
MQTSYERDDSAETLWFLAGMVAIGVGAAFLFGTEGGRKARRQLLSLADEAQQRLAEVQQVVEVARQLFEGNLPGEAAEERLRMVGER